MQPHAGGLAEGLKIGTQLGESQGLLLLPLQVQLLLSQQAQALFQPCTPGFQLVQGERFCRKRILWSAKLSLLSYLYLRLLEAL